MPPEDQVGPLEALEERVDAVVAAVKPHLRGWLHLAMAPLALVAGMVLVVLSDSQAARISAAEHEAAPAIAPLSMEQQDALASLLSSLESATANDPAPPAPAPGRSGAS